MKKLVVILVAALVLGGGGYIGWMQYFADGSGEGAGGGSASAGGESAPMGDQALFIELDPLTAPFLRDGKFAHYVLLVVSLEVGSKRDIERVREMLPRLRDAFVTELHTLAATRSPDQRPINVARVKARLIAGAHKALGPGVVRDVLVQLAH